MSDHDSSPGSYPAPVPPDLTHADAFVEYACLTYQPDDSPRRRRRAETLLAAHPSLVDESFFAAVALADLARVDRALAADASLARRRGGPRGWAPLLYLCYTRVFPARAGHDAVAVARRLLAAGADPNSQALFHGQYRFGAITGALGVGESGPVAAPPHPQARALVELLLDAGANPNDSQGLYNTHFEPDNAWLALFVERGLSAAHRASWTDDDPTRMLDYLLGQAVKQGYLDRVALLLAQGASAGGRDFYNQRTFVENAQLGGHTQIAALLDRHGAAPAVLSPGEQLRAACLRGEEALVRSTWSQPVDGRDDVATFLAAAEQGRLRAVRLLLDLGVSVDATNDAGVTALHLAASNGHRLVVDELLARGASASIRDRVHGGTPLGRVTWFSRVWPTAERDEVRRALAERSEDLFDVLYAGAEDRLATLLADDPGRVKVNLPHPLDGRSPVHVLAGRDVPNWAPLLAQLLSHGADLNLVNHRGQTPLDLAIEQEADDVAAALAQRGARRGA